jgi:hypothetical protein
MVSPLSSSIPVITFPFVLESISQAPFDRGAFDFTSYLSARFSLSSKENQNYLHDAFLSLRDRIVKRLNCPDILKVVSDEAPLNTDEKIVHLARVVSSINDSLRVILLPSINSEKFDRPFEEFDCRLQEIEQQQASVLAFHLCPEAIESVSQSIPASPSKDSEFWF